MIAQRFSTGPDPVLTNSIRGGLSALWVMDEVPGLWVFVQVIKQDHPIPADCVAATANGQYTLFMRAERLEKLLLSAINHGGGSATEA